MRPILVRLLLPIVCFRGPRGGESTPSRPRHKIDGRRSLRGADKEMAQDQRTAFQQPARARSQRPSPYHLGCAQTACGLGRAKTGDSPLAVGAARLRSRVPRRRKELTDKLLALAKNLRHLPRQANRRVFRTRKEGAASENALSTTPCCLFEAIRGYVPVLSSGHTSARASCDVSRPQNSQSGMRGLIRRVYECGGDQGLRNI